jgi:hypothetical protein
MYYPNVRAPVVCEEYAVVCCCDIRPKVDTHQSVFCITFFVKIDNCSWKYRMFNQQRQFMFWQTFCAFLSGISVGCPKVWPIFAVNVSIISYLSDSTMHRSSVSFVSGFVNDRRGQWFYIVHRSGSWVDKCSRCMLYFHLIFDQI